MKAKISAVLLSLLILSACSLPGAERKDEQLPSVQNEEASESADQEAAEKGESVESTFIDYVSKANGAGLKALPEGFKELFVSKGVVAPCTGGDGDGPCGFDAHIYAGADTDLSATAVVTLRAFYIGVEGGAGWDYYGPFLDDVKRIVDDAKNQSIDSEAK